ncbi:MAG: penicillin-binding protein 2 [Acidobacteriota bacterium]
MQLRRYRAELAHRVDVLARCVQIALILVATGYWSVQVANGAYYRGLAEHNRLRKVSIEPSRGLILDRTGRPLVENVPSYSLQLDRSRAADLDASLAFASTVLERPVGELHAVLEEHAGTPRFKPVPLAQQLSLEQIARISAQHLEYPDLEIVTEQLRLYRYGPQTAHVLGYLGEASPQDLTLPGSPYRPGDAVGKKGIERLYETTLRGRRGEQVVVVDSRGQTIDELDQVAATAGADLALTLDLELQQEAARLLDEKVGAIVAIDPRDGAVRALVSSPSFDPNQFARGLRADDWKALMQNPDHPLQNRAIQNTYPPASVFKIVMALAGLEEGAIDPQERVFCRGWSKIYGHRYRCGKASGHGWVDLEEAVRGSCNVYFHQLGQRLGVDTIAEYSKRLGLGETTGIDLVGEKRGLVPSTRWSLERRKMPWYPGETISVATGQGPILVTPLQAARLLGAVATGRLVSPRLQRDVPPRPSRPVDLHEAHLERIRRALSSVVNHERGTGGAARVDGLEIAGKTGTAQVVRQETWIKNDELAADQRDHAWFASYATVDAPELVVVVFVEHGGGGSSGAAPLAKALYETSLRIDLTHRSAV